VNDEKISKGARSTSWRYLTPLFLACFFLLAGCSSGRVAVTPGLIPQESYVSAEDEAYGHHVLSQITARYPLSRDDRAIERVRGLVNRLARSAKADRHPWNVFVLQGDDVVNAAATRGNYVFVWTGMLHLAGSDGELATVLAHEIGHLLANHTKSTPAEEASEIMAKVSGNIAGQVVAMQPEFSALAQLAAVVVSEAIKAIAVNPESQRLEMEADHIGFFLMADAGFDPRQALSFWTKMSYSPETAGMPLTFLSSHPNSADRLQALQTLLPEATARYERTRSRPKRNTKPKQALGVTSKSRRYDPTDDSFALP
jgi:predicted Zn-dependent protease